MELGAFSISLAVRDLAVSKSFDKKLGFVAFAGDAFQNWLIMRNGGHVTRLVQGMFERNSLTFNPGCDQCAQPLPSFTGVREIQRELKEGADKGTVGPACPTLEDPDGVPILIDQHVSGLGCQASRIFTQPSGSSPVAAEHRGAAPIAGEMRDWWR